MANNRCGLSVHGAVQGFKSCPVHENVGNVPYFLPHMDEVTPAAVDGRLEQKNAVFDDSIRTSSSVNQNPVQSGKTAASPTRAALLINTENASLHQGVNDINPSVSISDTDASPTSMCCDDHNRGMLKQLDQGKLDTYAMPDHFQELLSRVQATEYKLLTDAMICVLCKVNPIEVTLLPCGHFVLCAACSDTCYTCPVCYKAALAEVKTYLC